MSTATAETTVAKLADDTESAYRNLVVRVAGGEELDESVIRDALILSGHSLPEFQKRVELIRQRRTAADRMAESQRSDRQRAADELVSEARRIGEEIERLEKDYATKHDELTGAHIKTVADARAVRGALNDDEQRGRRVLLKTCDAGIRERIESKQQEIAATDNSLRALEQHRQDQFNRTFRLREAREELKRLKAQKGTPEDRIAQQVEKVKQRERHAGNLPSVAELEASIAAGQKQRVNLEAAIVELERSRLLPESIDWNS